MARAIIKTVNIPSGGTTGVSTTVSVTGASSSTVQGITNPPGQVVTGTLQDLQSGAIYNFMQPFGAEVGIQVGVKVHYTTVNGGGQVVANSLKLIHRGEIADVNSTDDGGTLIDKATGAIIPFAQVYATESGLSKGAKVNFQRIIDPKTAQITAVSLEVAGD